MSRPTDRQATLDILRLLADTALGQRLILGGSSGLYAASTKIPALTEDVDVLVDADWAAAHEAELLSEMQKVGFRHHSGTCTLTASSGHSLDLVGYSEKDRSDRIGGGEQVPIMIFADLSTLLQIADTTAEVATGGRALTAEALAVAKLLTIRLEKGAKDKIQALLLIEESGDDKIFLDRLRQLLDRFESDRIEDALADAKLAVLALSADFERNSAQTEGYAEMRPAVERGLEILKRLLEPTP